jgi:UDP-2-acetamido-3-amino-2,3-dideoxy-glucuronate N-acetyltransferase
MSDQGPVRINSKQTQTKVATIPWVKDPRGDLTVGEFESGFPFRRERYFKISGVSSGEIREEHAHKECHQFLICAYGQCSVTVDNGRNRLEVQLNRPNLGIYVPPMI